MDLRIGEFFDFIVNWMRDNWEPFFNGIKNGLDWIIRGLEDIFNFPNPYIMIVIISLIAWKLAGKWVGLFSIISLFVVYGMNMWSQTMDTLAMVIASAGIALIIGIPVGITASKFDRFDRMIRPVLDFMQTMPAFVYLIPAVLFFGLGRVPGSVATIIFSMPPVIRLTNLAIRQVPTDVVEAAISFGSTPAQMLFKVQIPIALPTIFAGINQTIMLSLSMVVISAMIGAGGLGEQVLNGITQLRIGLGFESGLAVVILAMVLDRITQSLGKMKK